MKKVILILFLSLVLSACDMEINTKADQIKAQAQADAQFKQSLQQAADAEAARVHQEELNRISEAAARQEATREQARKNAVEQEVIHELNLFVQIIAYVLIACAVFVSFRGTQATVSAYQIAVIGIGKAIAQSADIRSRLIYLDDGRQFPAILSNNTVTDITTQQVTDTNTPQLGNSQAITGAIANRHVGIVARETRKSKPDTAPSTSLAQNPPIIEAKFSDVKEYLNAITKAGKDE